VIFMRTALPALAALIVFASSASAQPTFASLQPGGLPTVYVVDRTGTETQGRLVSITESLISVDVNGATKTFTPDDVSLIERKGDSLKNGAVIGTVVGAGLGVLSMGLADCPAGRDNCPGTRAAGFLLSVGIYAAIGTGFDAAVSGRTRIWPRPRQQAGGLVFSASPAERRAFVGWRMTR
jgi:hypothetical protein